MRSCSKKVNCSDSSLQNAFSFSQTPPQSTSRWSELDLLSFLGTVGHVLSLGASSFIEEEHQTWYFLVNTLCLALCHQIYRHCLLGDDCAPQRCPHTGEEFDGVAVALQGKRAGPEGWEPTPAAPPCIPRANHAAHSFMASPCQVASSRGN